MRNYKASKLFDSPVGGIATYNGTVAVGSRNWIKYRERGHEVVRNIDARDAFGCMLEILQFSPCGKHIIAVGRKSLLLVHNFQSASSTSVANLRDYTPTCLAVGKKFIALSQICHDRREGVSIVSFFEMEPNGLKQLLTFETDYDGRVSVCIISEDLEEGDPGERVVARFVVAGEYENAGEFVVYESDRQNK